MQLHTSEYKITVLVTHRGLFWRRVNAVASDRTSSLIRFIGSCVLTKDRRKGLDRDREKVR